MPTYRNGPVSSNVSPQKVTMRNLHEISRHYLRLVAEADRVKNTDFMIDLNGGRTIYFWDARNFARQLGIDDFELNEVVRFLSAKGLLYWRHNYDTVKTVELTDKGFKWEFHESLLQHEQEQESKVVNNISIVNNSGLVNVQGVLENVTQSIQSAPSLSGPKREELAGLFDQLKAELLRTPTSHSEHAEVLAEQAKDISEELKRPQPRDSMLRIKGSGLVEAAKALGSVLPAAMAIAKQIAEFIANPAG